MLEEDATYVMLDGGKLSDAVKKATSTTPSTFSFTLPTTGTIYSSSSLSEKHILAVTNPPSPSFVPIEWDATGTVACSQIIDVASETIGIGPWKGIPELDDPHFSWHSASIRHLSKLSVSPLNKDAED